MPRLMDYDAWRRMMEEAGILGKEGNGGKGGKDKIEEEIEGKISYPVRSFRELLEEEDIEEPIIEGILDAGELMLLYGMPKVGKTFLACQMAVEVAKGMPFLGKFPTQGGTTLFLSLEETKRGIRKKLKYLYPNEDGSIEAFFVFPSPSIFSFEALKQTIEAYRPSLVIIDNLVNIFLAQQESRQSAYEKETEWLNSIKNITKEFPNLAIVVLHHLNKQNEYLGTTAIKGVPDVMMEVRKEKEAEGVLQVEIEARSHKCASFNIRFQEGEEERGWVYVGEVEDLKIIKVKGYILDLLKGGGIWQRKDILEAIKKIDESISEETTIRALGILLKEGKIQRPQHGKYAST